MSRYVEQGVLDCGLTGLDWTQENASKVKVVEDLVYSKVSARSARWVLAVAGDSPYQKIEDLEGKKIATELVNFTKRYFKERSVNVLVEFSWGATEAKVVSGLADAVVEVTETESTIRAHGLRILEEMMQTNTQLIANRQSWKDEWKNPADRLVAPGRPPGRRHGGVEDERPAGPAPGHYRHSAQPERPHGGAAS
jgi:ATP phosphoribosyltransferase